MNTVKVFTERMIQDAGTASSHIKFIDHHFTQALYPTHFTLDVIELESGSWSLRYEVKPLTTDARSYLVNEVCSPTVASSILSFLDEISDIIIPEDFASMGSVSIGRRFQDGEDSITIVSEKYRISVTYDERTGYLSKYIRIDGDVGDSSEDIDILDNVVVERGGERVIEDGDYVYHKSNPEKRIDETIRVELTKKSNRSFKDELKEKALENIASL